MTLRTTNADATRDSSSKLVKRVADARILGKELQSEMESASTRPFDLVGLN